MLKAYAIENLRSGMKVGRDVVEADGNTLLTAGTILNNDIIFNLLDRPIFSIYIEEPDVEADISGKEFLLDNNYVTTYNEVYESVGDIFTNLRESGQLDIDNLHQLIRSKRMRELSNGAKAVSQIHNMTRSGGYLIHHCIHVAILAGLMARWMRLPVDKGENLVAAGLLHDVGKLKISEAILDKPGKLTDEEFAEVKKHPAYGYEMLKNTALSMNRDILLGVLQHHERCDGSGYPNHAVKDQISDFGRILAILDVYDAMAADRVFAKRRSPFDVFDVLHDDVLSGKLDPEYGVKFIRYVGHALNGNWVMLSDGRRGRIVYIDESRVNALPVVQTTTGEFVDLNRSSDVKIDYVLTASEASE